jgi:hypothetical protein
MGGCSNLRSFRVSTWKGPTKLAALVATLALLGIVPSESALPHRSSYPMRSLEGEVLAVEYHAGEGDLPLVQAQLQATNSREPVQILLAPQEVCEQIGLQIAPGDRIRTRVFVEDTASYRVQKIQNISRGTMVRLRTLHEIPLWDSAGRWQGGPLRTSPTHQHHGRGRGGGPPR